MEQDLWCCRNRDERSTGKQAFELGFEQTSASFQLAETSVFSKQPAKEAMTCHDHKAIDWTYAPF